MSKLKPTPKSTHAAANVAAALADIFPRVLINMSRLGGTQACSALTLTPPQLRALLALDIAEKPLRMSALAQVLGVTQSTTTDVTKRLAGMGYIEKQKLKDDERVTYVSLSQQGRETVAELRREKHRQFLAICEKLPEAQRERLLKSHQLILEIYSAM